MGACRTGMVGTARKSAPLPTLQADHASPLEFQHVEADQAVDHVDQAALVERDVVALWRRLACHGLGDVVANLPWALRIGDVDDPQPAAEPDGVNDGARYALAELVRAEACARRAAERRIELAHLELADRLDVGKIGDIERQNARVRAAAPRFLLAGALRLVFLVDRERD